MLVALIGMQDTVIAEHEFTLNHLLGKDYRKGDGGAEIRLIKDRMKENGYYTPNAAYSSKFNKIMEARITDFQESSGLYPTGVIDDETPLNLYAAAPVKGPCYPTPYDEPELTMMIPQNSNLRSIPRENDGLSVDIKKLYYRDGSKTETLETPEYH